MQIPPNPGPRESLGQRGLQTHRRITESTLCSGALARVRRLLPSLTVAATALLASCATRPTAPSVTGIPPSWGDFRITDSIIPSGHAGRGKSRPLTPRHITIHSTQNFAAAAGAAAHAAMLRTGALKASHNSLGYLTWHFTVDDHSIHQSLPCNEQGQHADYEGPGNRTSIGIEMCENRGNSRAATLDRTAKLTALLMKQYGIPLANVVPHQHWRMVRYSDHRDLGHKDCPWFLLEHSKGNRTAVPGAKWQAFLAKIDGYRKQL